MPISEEQREIIETLIRNVTVEWEKISTERTHIRSLLGTDQDVNDNTIETRMLANAKQRAKTAAQAMVDLLT